jgi:hypothetical protein
MAIFRIFPEKDTFIFSEGVTGNAGKDEILELGGYPGSTGTGQTNRILLKYSSAEIQDVIDNKIQSDNYSASLHLYLADAYQLPIDYTVYGYPVYGGWDNGKGKFNDIPTDTSGVSWQYRRAGQTTPWETETYPQDTTGSYINQYPGGGTWYLNAGGVSVESTQSHATNSTHDVDLDVTNAIKQFQLETIENNGFILKLADELEFNTTSSIRLKYFGADTNTIYPPYLELKWDDSEYITGSLSVLSNNVSTIGIINNRGKYTGEGKQRFRVAAKPKYPVRSFSTSSVYLKNYALPSASYWGLRDENTEEMVVDFDTDFTKVSCDQEGPYFDVYMDGLQPERYYRILVKTELDGSTVVVDNQNIFKVVRNG